MAQKTTISTIFALIYRGSTSIVHISRSGGSKLFFLGASENLRNFIQFSAWKTSDYEIFMLKIVFENNVSQQQQKNKKNGPTGGGLAPSRSHQGGG